MVIVTDKCISCQACVPACPVNAISMKNGKAYIDPNICVKCEYCVGVCPVDAIEVK